MPADDASWWNLADYASQANLLRYTSCRVDASQRSKQVCLNQLLAEPREYRNTMEDEHELLEQGLGRLRDLLGAGWQVEPLNRPPPPDAGPWMTADATEQLVNIYSQAGGGGSGQVLVEATRALTPMRARKEFGPKLALMHSLTGSAAVLVVAPWLSPRTRETLEQLGYGYLDLTGNVSLRLRQPAVVIRTEGAKQDPQPSGKPTRQNLRGARAGRLVRVLVDVTPPYRATELAEASGLSLSYVSRLLDALEEEALITREGRSVASVDWDQLIRVRAAQYSLLDANSYVTMLAPQGPDVALTRLAECEPAIKEIGQVAVTGPFAARKVVPNVTVGGQLMLYVPPDPRHDDVLDKIASILGLLRSDIGADVLMLRAASEMVFQGMRRVAGAPHVALSQLALDSLSGSGRMPAEGEALLNYMAEHEEQWRARSLRQLPWMATPEAP